jgi:hypothetical protein
MAGLLAWSVHSRIGRAGAALLAVGGAILGALALGRGQGRRAARAEQAEAAVATMEKINEASAGYRADGAAQRMRDGTF